MNEVAEWIQQYGYVAVLLGTFVEGESIALLGGFLAHGELLDLRLVMVVSFIGSFCGDQTAFWLGRVVRFALEARSRRWCSAGWRMPSSC